MTFGPRRQIAALAASAAFLIAAGAATSRAHAASSAVQATFTPAQAVSGATTYAANCSQCHGANLEGGVGPALSGATLRTLSKNTKLTVGDMFTFFSQQMPLNAPASLKHDQYVAIMAFILKKNGYPAGTKPLSYNSAMNSTTAMTSKI